MSVKQWCLSIAGTDEDWMSRVANNCKIAPVCWIAMLIILISGKFAFRLEPIALLDKQILEWFAASRTVELDRFFTCVSWAGSSFFLLPLLYAIAFFISIRHHVQEGIFLVCSFFGISAINNVAKHFIARPRPNLFPAVIEIPEGFSFPSSHSVQITAFVLAVLLVMKTSIGARWYIFSIVLGGSLIMLVCISRLYLQVHFPTDVVAGFLAALLWIVGLEALMLPDRQAPANPLSGRRIEKGKQP